MDTNIIQEGIYQAAKTIAENLASELKFDRTIQATIVSLKNADTGEYRIKYAGASNVPAYARDVTESYKVGESVYVQCINSDFSESKFIVGRVTQNSLSAIQLTQLQNQIIERSPSIDVFYEFEDIPKDQTTGEIIGFGVRAGAAPDESGYGAIIYNQRLKILLKGTEYYRWEGDGENKELKTYTAEEDADIIFYLGPGNWSSFVFESNQTDSPYAIWTDTELKDRGNHLLFQQYASQYSHIQIAASFHTELLSTHSKGNYGLQIEFLTADGALKTKTYRLDLSSFNGSPYKFSNWAEQDVVFEVPVNTLVGLNSVKLFQEQFDTDGNNAINIFVKDIKIKFVDVIDMSQVEYYPLITAPFGNTFPIYRNGEKMELQAHLYNKGEDLASNSKTTFLWYVRDLNVAPGTTNYDKVAGAGWRPIQTLESINYENTYRLTLYQSIDENSNYTTDYVVHYNRQYKVVITHGDIVTSTEFEVYNRTSTAQAYNFSLSQELKNDRTYLKLTSGYSGDLYYLALDGSYGKVESYTVDTDPTKSISSIDVTDYLTAASITFYCEVKSENVNLGVLTYTFHNSESQDDIVVSFVGDDKFLYDANGELTYEDGQKTRSLTPKVEIINDHISLMGVSTSWWIGDQEIGDYAHKNTPENSMIKEIWFDSTVNVLYYKIQEKHDYNKRNNTLTLKIQTLDKDEPYYFRKELLFLKSGDQGTNGTNFFCVAGAKLDNGISVLDYHPLRVSLATHLLHRENEDDNVYWLGGAKFDISSADTEKTITLSGSPWLHPDKHYYQGFLFSDDEKIYQTRTKNIFSTLKPSENQNLELGYEIYNNGVRLNDVSKVTISWTAEGVTLDNNNVVGCILSQSKGLETPHYVRLKATYNGKVAYSYYPIDIEISSENGLTNVDVESIPRQVKYTSSGVRPIVNKSPLEFYYGGVPGQPGSGTKGTVWNLTPKLFTNTEDSEKGITGQSLSPIYELPYDSHAGLLKLQTTDNNYILRTVIMYLDTYGNEAINQWDGMSIDLGADEDGNSLGSIFAPQVGAGKKEESNKFTGVVMGQDSNEKQIGLYGYQDGITSFGLRTDGTAFFGKSGGGRIWIRGDKSFIYGGNCADLDQEGKPCDPKLNEDGMILRLDAGSGHGTSPAIQVGRYKETNKGAFQVNYNGNMFANNAEIRGTIHATQGEIAEWTIDGYKIKSNNFLLDSTPVPSGELASNQPQFTRYPESLTELVTKRGVTYTVGASLEDGRTVGKILMVGYDSEGRPLSSYTFLNAFSISFMIMDNTFVPITTSLGLADVEKITLDREVKSINNRSVKQPIVISSYTTDIIRIQGGTNFFVTNGGYLKAKDVEITGDITAKSGNISNWKISKSGIYSYGGRVGISDKGDYSFWAGNNTSIDTESGSGTVNKTYKNTSGKLPRGTRYYYGENNVRVAEQEKNITFTSEPFSFDGNEYCYFQIQNDNTTTYWALFGDLETTTPYFYVKSDGTLGCRGADINGKIKALKGEIGGWAISSTGLYSLDGTIGMSKSGKYRFWSDGRVKTGSSGEGIAYDTLSAGAYYWYSNGQSQVQSQIYQDTNVMLTGDVWNNGIGDLWNFYFNDTVCWAYSTSFKSEAPYFYVTSNGKLGCRNADISGKITADSGKIGSWNIRNNRLENDDQSIYIGPSGIKYGGYFSVNNNGLSISGNIIATGGSIGNWNIESNMLKNGNIYIDPSGIWYNDNLYLKSTGEAKIGGLTVYSNGSTQIEGTLTALTGGDIGGLVVAGSKTETSPVSSLIKLEMNKGLISGNDMITSSCGIINQLTLTFGSNKFIYKGNIISVDSSMANAMIHIHDGELEFRYGLQRQGSIKATQSGLQCEGLTATAVFG